VNVSTISPPAAMDVVLWLDCQLRPVDVLELLVRKIPQAIQFSTPKHGDSLPNVIRLDDELGILELDVNFGGVHTPILTRVQCGERDFNTRSGI